MPPISLPQSGKSGSFQSGLRKKYAMSENDLASFQTADSCTDGLYRSSHGSAERLADMTRNSLSPTQQVETPTPQVETPTPQVECVSQNVSPAAQAHAGPLVGDWIVQSQIGSGHSSSVYAAMHTQHKLCATMKVVDMIQTATTYGSTLNYNQVMQRMYEEATIMADLKHGNIVSIYEAFVSKKYFYICMEYIKGNVLLNYMKAEGMSEDKVRTIMAQLLDAVDYLHSRDIVHGDIKGENVMLNEENGHVTLIDFGFARHLLHGDSVSAIGWTRLYAPPEAFDTGMVSKAWDVWSCGVVMYALLTGLFPFHEEALAKKAFPSELVVPGSTSNEAIQLLTSLLRVNPHNRITAKQALQLPFFQKC